MILAAGTTLFPETLVFPPYGHSYGIRKATPKHLFMFFGPRTFFDEPMGLATAKMVSRDDPESEKDDDEVVVYGVNSGRHQLIYNTSMWALALYGERGSGRGQFHNPHGVATEPHGNVFVADKGNNRVVHLFNPEKKVRWVKAFDGRGGGDPGVVKPTYIDLDTRCNIYVVDSGNRRIVVFDSAGTVVRTIPEGTGFLFEGEVRGLAVADGADYWSYPEFNNERVIFCADRDGTRLWKIGFDGTVINRTAFPPGYHAFFGAVDYYHNCYFTDMGNHCVLKFDHNINLLDIFGRKGIEDNEFIEPRGITIWKRYGQTFIAEKKGAQYYWVGTDCKEASLKRMKNNRYRLNVTTTAYSYVSIAKIHSGDTSYCLSKRTVPPGGASVVFTDRNGCIPRAGSSLRMIAEPTYSSYSYYKWTYPITREK
jgi:hypothetical protein